MKKITAVITARASYSRSRTILLALQKRKDVDLELILTSSSVLIKYGGVQPYLKKDNLTPKYIIYNQLNEEDSSSQVKTTAVGMIELANYLRHSRPDALITIADRHETLGNAIAASYMNIPLIHIQGGERSGNIDDKVRFSISALADYHFVSNENAAATLKKSLNSTENIFNLGCPSIDIAKEIETKEKLDFNLLFKNYSWAGNKFLNPKYMVVLQHSVTNETEYAHQQMKATLCVLKEMKIPTFIFWPNIDNGTDQISREIRIFKKNNSGLPIAYFKSLDPIDFLLLIRDCLVFMGNSSVGVRESSFFGTPVVNIGTRQQFRDRASNVIDTNYDKHEIIKACKIHIEHGRYPKSTLYGDGYSGQKIADKISDLIK